METEKKTQEEIEDKKINIEEILDYWDMYDYACSREGGTF
jgi:hypothetical protein